MSPNRPKVSHLFVFPHSYLASLEREEKLFSLITFLDELLSTNRKSSELLPERNIYHGNAQIRNKERP